MLLRPPGVCGWRPRQRRQHPTHFRRPGQIEVQLLSLRVAMRNHCRRRLYASFVDELCKPLLFYHTYHTPYDLNGQRAMTDISPCWHSVLTIYTLALMPPQGIAIAATVADTRIKKTHLVSATFAPPTHTHLSALRTPLAVTFQPSVWMPEAVGYPSREYRNIIPM